MGLTETVAERARLVCVKRGALTLIASTDAQAFLDECAACELRILGIEGFMKRGDELIPDMSAIADFSDAIKSHQSILDARRFVAEISPGLMLDFCMETGDTT